MRSTAVLLLSWCMATGVEAQDGLTRVIRIGWTGEYILPSGSIFEDLGRGVGVRLHGDFPVASAWVLRVSAQAARHSERFPLAVPDTRLALPLEGELFHAGAFGLSLGPRARYFVNTDRLVFTAGVDAGVAIFDAETLMNALRLGGAAGAELRVARGWWLTTEAGVDRLYARSIGLDAGYHWGTIMSIRVGIIRVM